MTSKTLKKSVVGVAIAAALTGAYSINSEHEMCIRDSIFP